MADTPPDPPTVTDLAEMAKFLLLPVTAAAAGIVARWSEDVRSGRRLTWRRIILEAPSAVGFGIMGGGIAVWLGVPAETSWAISAALGHLGAQGTIDLIMHFRSRSGRDR